MQERGRVAVYHPNQPAIVGNNEVRVWIPLQEAGEVRQSRLYLAVNHHAALSGEIAGENDTRLALRYRGGRSYEKRADGKTSGALIGRILILIARGIIELLARGMHEHGILCALAIVDFRAGQVETRRLDFRRSVFYEQDGQSVRRHAVDFRDDHAETMRIDEPGIDPALLGFGG